MPNGCIIWLNGAFGVGKTTDNGEAPGYSSTDTRLDNDHFRSEPGVGTMVTTSWRRPLTDAPILVHREITVPGSTDTRPPEARDIPIDPTDLAQFRNAAGRSLRKHLDYSFIRTYRPVLDDGPGRSFDSMADYRRWCNRSLPRWLGYASD